jgi:hypothetical protein
MAIAPTIRSASIIIAAHGNSLRALVKYLDSVPDADIVELQYSDRPAARVRARSGIAADSQLLPRRRGADQGEDGGRREPGEGCAGLMATLDVITFGEAMAMFVADEPGDLARVSRFTRRQSGADANVAIGLARLGLRVGWVSRVGDDSFGRFILKTMTSEGVDCSP